MSTKYTRDNVNILLVDTDLGARQGVRMILSNNGFSNVTLGSNMERLLDVISRTMPDLLITGTKYDDGDVTKLIRDIRANRIGNNPFLPIIVVLDEPTPELVTNVMNAGPDDVIMKPISTKSMLERIQTQIHNRRPYIVSDQYVGPARKGDDTTRAFDPPNPLEDKATGGKPSYHEIERGIQTAMAEVNNRRLENRGPEIAALVGRLGPMLDKPSVNDAALGGLNMLIDLNEEMMIQLQNSKYDHVSELCRAMISVSQRLTACAGKEPDKTQVKLLKPLSQAIQAGFAGGINSRDAARMIVERIGVTMD